MLHDPDLHVRTRRRREPRELGADGIALRMLAGFAFGLLLIQLIAWETGRPGVALLLGFAR